MSCVFRNRKLLQPGDANESDLDSNRVRSVLVCLFMLILFAQSAEKTLADDNESAVLETAAVTSSALDVSDRKEKLVGEPINMGYVIIGGIVLARPYCVAQEGHKVYVNDKLFAVLRDERDRDDRTAPALTGTDPKHFVATLEQNLASDFTAIAFNDRTRVMLHAVTAAGFLDALGRAESLEERVQLTFSSGLESSGPGANLIPSFQWRSALAGYESTGGVALFIQEMGVSKEIDVDAAWEPDYEPYDPQDVDSSDRLYFVNVFGMLLVAISMGILLGHPPSTNVRWSKIVDSKEASGLVVNCLVLVVALSAFDLTCTLIAETVRGFEELNPFAESLVGSPLVLIAFKAASSLLGVALLWFRRRYAGAQLASWWLCLILTLVSARWVVIQSLFYL